ncbi:MAG: carboxypeptidase regulatory-like domain-containing protein [Sphingobacteriaceae bacterium]
MIKRKHTIQILLTSLLVCISFIGFAQVTSSSISGKVKDPAGETLPGATVVIVHQPTGTSYKAVTSAEGLFRIGNLNPGGPYRITVSFVGFNNEVREQVFINLGVDQRLEFNLKDQSNQLSEVKITAEKGGDKTGAGTKISSEQIKRLPSISRSLQDLTRLTPQSSNNSFGGTNFRYNNVTIDGAINNDAIGFSPSLGGQSNTSGQPGSSTRTNPVSIDAIQDIQVSLAPFDVKNGNFTGGSINAVTRSGTNNFEGSVYTFGRNAAMVGPNNAGDGSKMPSNFLEYQSGFRLGMPIVKNKVFFFTNEEITRRNDPVIFAAGSPDMFLSKSDADAIAAKALALGFNAGTSDNTKIFSNSNKFFNRVDWNINDKNQLAIRNNTISSKATNLERDQFNFRFGGIDFTQLNKQSSTVLEFKSRLSNSVNNSFIMGYSSIHDYRQPNSGASNPQIEITSGAGNTIFLGTDREASIFNMKQKTFEITDNLTFFKGNHTITVGTHNELYTIQYGFVNAWNGRISYSSIANFLANNPNRVRGNYNYTNNSEAYLRANPSALFKVNMYSAYAQDEIQVSDRLKLTPGIRFDLADIPNKPNLSAKTTAASVDVNAGTTYSNTLPKDITNSYLGKIQVSPRLGFTFDAHGDKSLVLRGGSGLFTGRIPFAWLGYAFYNNGDTYGAYDQKFAAPYVGAVNPASPSANGLADFVNSQKGAGYTQNATTATQVDLIDNNFKMPQVWRSNLALDFTTENRFKFTLEGIFTKVITDLKFQHVNLIDNVIYYPYDVNHQQPIFQKVGGTQAINSQYTNAYLLSNTSQGYRYSLTAQVSKSFPVGLDIMAAYTYGQSKDITNGIRNSMESNWQLNPALNPNNPQLSYSNFDVRHRIVSTINYAIDWHKKGRSLSNFAIYFNAQSGAPFTYGLVNATVQNTAQNLSLVYIPKAGETVNFFSDIVGGATAVQQAAAFDSYIDSDKYLSSRRGNFTERNAGRTPWIVQADFRFSQDFKFTNNGRKSVLTFNLDILNITNMLNKNWGKVYFSPNTLNSTTSVGLSKKADGTAATYPKYTFSTPTSKYATDLFASRYQMQIGARYSF